ILFLSGTSTSAFVLENPASLQESLPTFSRGQMEGSKDLIVDSSYYSNFYQPSRYPPYYNNLYNYPQYQVSDTDRTGTEQPLSGGPVPHTLGVPPTGFPEGQGRIGENLLANHNMNPQYQMHSYYSAASYLGQSIGSSSHIRQLMAMDESPTYTEPKMSSK
uniref:Uncharacterized protein n=1 Tax=Erpetoichthys calabaricus TaxID=27687 RepID=A0A8C4SJ08_ERPCA